MSVRRDTKPAVVPIAEMGRDTDEEFVIVPDNESDALRFKGDRESLAGFARSEYLAHVLAYELSANTDTNTPGKVKVQVTDEDGIARTYQVTKVLTENPGIVSFILTGTDPENPRVQVLFRGTECGASIHRDLESYGAGSESFQKEKNHILLQINEKIKEVARCSGRNVKMTIAGHSLGGADTQNCAAAILQAQALNLKEKREESKKPSFAKRLGRKLGKLLSSCKRKSSKDTPYQCRDGFNLIESMDICTANSAGVSKDTAKKCKAAVAAINDPAYRDDRIDIHARFLHVAGDGVQQTGQTTILSDINPSQAKVELIKLDNGYEGMWKYSWNLVHALIGVFGTAKAHTSFHFRDTARMPEDISYELLSNETPEGRDRIKSKLRKKWWFESTSFSYWVKKIAHTMAKPFISCMQLPEDLLKEIGAEKRSREDTIHLRTKPRESRTTDDIPAVANFDSATMIRTDFLKQYGLRVPSYDDATTELVSRASATAKEHCFEAEDAMATARDRRRIASLITL